MKKYKLVVLKPITDIKTKQVYKVGDIIIIDEERYNNSKKYLGKYLEELEVAEEVESIEEAVAEEVEDETVEEKEATPKKQIKKKKGE